MTLNTADVSSADSSLSLRWLVVFFTQGSQLPDWQSRMGVASIDCISGCECPSAMIGRGTPQPGINLDYKKTKVGGTGVV
jgi:hypothetical protein